MVGYVLLLCFYVIYFISAELIRFRYLPLSTLEQSE